MEPLVIEVTVPCSAGHAFATWTEDIARWWPIDHSFSAEPGLRVVFEPKAGGRIYERTTTGVEHDWGLVVEFEPPHRLVYLWHIAASPADATEVEVSFAEHDGETTVKIEHRGWERLGADAETRRDRNRHGWDALLPHFTAACS